MIKRKDRVARSLGAIVICLAFATLSSAPMHKESYAARLSPSLRIGIAETACAGDQKPASGDQRDHSSEPIWVVANTSYDSVTFLPDGQCVASGSEGIDIWDCSTRTRRYEFQGKTIPPGTCRFLAPSPNGKTLLSFHSTDHLREVELNLCIWDVTEKKHLRHNQTLLSATYDCRHYPTELRHAGFSPDSQKVVVGSPEGRIHVYDLAAKRKALEFNGEGLAAYYSQDGQHIMSIGFDGQLACWKAATGSRVPLAEKREQYTFIYPTLTALSNNRTTLALSDYHMIVLKDAVTGEELQRIGRYREVNCMAFSTDNTTLAIGVDDLIVFVDVSTGKERSRFRSPRGPVHAVAFSPCGRYLALAQRKALSFWNLPKLLPSNRTTVTVNKVHTVGSVLPLEGQVSARKKRYVLDLGGKDARSFAKDVALGQEIAPPAVNLEVCIRNVSDRPVALEEPCLLDFYLVGKGALNIPTRVLAIAAGRQSKVIKLLPGEKHLLNIKQLVSDTNSRCYWVLPGEYQVFLDYYIAIKPAPEGAVMVGDGFGYISLNCPPVTVEVVDREK